jgi:hypothetical protein
MERNSPVQRSIDNTYNLDGSLLSVSVPSFPDGSHPRTLTYNVGGAGRPLSVNTMLTAAHYTPSGALCFISGNYGANYKSTSTYNHRLQPVTIQAVAQFTGSIPTPVCAAAPPSAPPLSTNILDLAYNFVDPNGHNNGNVASSLTIWIPLVRSLSSTTL